MARQWTRPGDVPRLMRRWRWGHLQRLRQSADREPAGRRVAELDRVPVW